jgi:hypothetical protein
LATFAEKDHPAIGVLIDRLLSTDQMPHGRACVAWALGRIGAKASEVVPILLALIEETSDQVEADELRSYAAESIEHLTGEMDVLLKVARRCLVDRFDAGGYARHRKRAKKNRRQDVCWRF